MHAWMRAHGCAHGCQPWDAHMDAHIQAGEWGGSCTRLALQTLRMPTCHQVSHLCGRVAAAAPCAASVAAAAAAVIPAAAAAARQGLGASATRRRDTGDSPVGGYPPHAAPALPWNPT
eukprot:350734-Chlamydomonas_euryale.AAC.2